MTRFDSIVVGNDLVSEHWLAEQFPAAVGAMRAGWKEKEEFGKTTPRSGLTALASRFGAGLVKAREQGDDGLFRALHQAVREALLLPGDEVAWSGGRADTAIAAVAPRTPSGSPPLLVVAAHDAATVEDLLDGEGAGQLLTPATVDGKVEPVTARVISAAFLTDEPPSLVLVTAGAWLLLAERERWPEGRWLAVDLATACERRDTSARGELETIAALVSGDVLLPADYGTVPLLGLLDESVKHAIGVSKDLRNGVRESIELLATEVLRRRGVRGLTSDGSAGGGLAPDLTRQALRYLYRILFLLYAEARPELGVLPVGTAEYAEGYGLDRLRELVLTDLTSETAEQGTHLYQSLGVLFRLVNDGYPPETLGSDGAVLDTDTADDRGGLRFEALRADLFSPQATALIDEVGLGNGCLQDVLGRLLLSRKQRGRDRGFVNYAQLGINQLGAVYEGLMSYTGSIAGDHMVEVAKDGDPSKGSWVVPLTDTAGFDDRWFVTTTDPQTGEIRRVAYQPGDFVFRLSGRDRQRSASYYTPEVLTRCVVTHSLAELLTDSTTAADVLGLSVCEPALGSGAFLVEAINQLAGQYLTRRQAELGTRIDPEQYPVELQKVKAYLALHNCYGVDLNATAVELAEITLWLDAMHPGLRAPWFGLHLRRGNSLIGARRETWTPAQVAKRGWLTTVPTARPLGTALSPYEVHHFLLPAAGWGAVADTKEAKEGRPAATAALKTWRRGVTSVLGKPELTRLQGIALRIEALWALAQRRLEVAEAEIRRAIPIWGADDLPAGTGAVQREQIEASLTDPDSAYRRLRRVMDSWAALWFWPVTTSVSPPTRAEWMDALEALLGTVSKTEAKRGRGMWGADTTWAELEDAEHNEVVFGQMRPVAEVLAVHPWLEVCERIAEREGFFHWELDFAPVFARGGFDLQVGNPPWVRPAWDEPLVLAEDDAWFGLAEKPDVGAVRDRREKVLDDGDVRYLDERASLAGTGAHLGSGIDRPLLAGTQPDLYRCFMDRTWRSMGPRGTVGLIHPESHFTEGRAGGLRRETYRRLRRHWQFRNELRLFEIMNTRVFGVSIYGRPRSPQFLNIASLYDPGTVDRSLVHDGSGEVPGGKDDAGKLDLRPHAARIVRVDEMVLEHWAALIDEPGTPPGEARMLRPVNTASQQVLNSLAAAPRFSGASLELTAGWHESADHRKGYFVRRTDVANSLQDVILQGPHLGVANPFFQNPRPDYKSFKDYDTTDLEQLGAEFIPRTNFQRDKPVPTYTAGYPRWGSVPANEFFRIAWRGMADTSMVRTLYSAILPPGPMHVHGIMTLHCVETRDLAVAAGMWASLLTDFLVKVSVASAINESVVTRFPHPRSHPLVPELILRALRLNCLTADYAPFWEELFAPAWQQDRWTRDIPARPLGEVDHAWTMSTPLRRDAERRQALVEIDALAAVMLGITAEELCAIYRTQFGVLRKYERVMQHDANGRQVPRDVLKEHERFGSSAELGRYELPFTPVDREAEMTVAHAEFTRRAAGRV